MTLAAPPQSSVHNTETLNALLALVAAHDRKAFAALYQATSLKLFGIVLRILKQRALAEDVLQEVYVKIWERAGDFTPARGSPITWMASIARHRALDEVRRGKHFVASQDVADFEEIPSVSINALEHMQQNEDYQKLAGCLETIEEEKRHMVLLAYEQGFSREVLSQKFGQPVATIKTWLRRSLQSLKVCLDS